MSCSRPSRGQAHRSTPLLLETASVYSSWPKAKYLPFRECASVVHGRRSNRQACHLIGLVQNHCLPTAGTSPMYGLVQRDRARVSG